MKLLPREPTEDMTDAAMSVFGADSNSDMDMYDLAAEAYRAMYDAAPSPWRPIETAPKDERTKILVASDRGNVWMVRWEKMTRVPDRWSAAGLGALLFSPVAWMPIPPFLSIVLTREKRVEEHELMIADCEAREDKLTDWERSFIDSVSDYIKLRPLTAKQAEQLDKIWERVT